MQKVMKIVSHLVG